MLQLIKRCPCRHAGAANFTAQGELDTVSAVEEKEKDRRFWLSAGTAATLGLLVFSRTDGALVFGAGDLKVLDADLPVWWAIWVSPVVIAALWIYFLQSPRERAASQTLLRIGVVALVSLAALVVLIRAHAIREDLRGQRLSIICAVVPLVYWIRRGLSGRSRARRAMRFTASTVVVLLSVPVLVTGVSHWVEARIMRAGARIEQMPRDVRRFAQANFFGADMSGIGMDGARFVDADLRRVALDGATITASTFLRSPLAGAKLTHAILATTMFCCVPAGATESCPQPSASTARPESGNHLGFDIRGSPGDCPDLSDLALAYSNLTDVSFDGADLRGVDLTGVRGKNVTFRRVDLRGAKLTGMQIENLRIADATLRDMDLTGVRLRNIDFSGSHFDAATLTGVHGEGAVFDDVSFEQAKVEGANFNGAKFRRARLTGAQARKAVFTSAKMRGSHLDQADLTDADFSGADLTCADLRGARLPAAEAFADATLEGAILSPSERPKFASDRRLGSICFDADGAGCSAKATARRCANAEP